MDERRDPDDAMPPAEAEQPSPAASRDLLASVRQAAGFRVSPRQLAAALDALAETGVEPTAERLVAVIQAGRGERSARQRRYADLWRALGAQLALRGAPADPAAQQALIGHAKAIARGEVSDLMLLRVALAVAAESIPLEPRVVGEAARWILDHHGAEAGDEAIVAAVPEALTAIAAERARQQRRGGPRRSAAAAPRRIPTRRGEHDPIRRRRRAKPAGTSRKPRPSRKRH